MPSERRAFLLAPLRFGASVTFVLAACSATAAAVASCSSDGDGGNIDVADAATDSASDAMTLEAGSPDAAPPAPDAAAFDGGPLPIVCASSSCATSLTTTFSTSDQEGFCALLQDQTVACWGGNDSGQLGRGDDAGAVGSAIPEKVPGLLGIVQLANTCAVDASGSAWCWGTGPYLQQQANLGARTTERTPVKLALPPATSVSVGGGANLVGCAVLEDGAVVCWGHNGDALIAPFETAPSTATLPPTEVAMPSGPPIRRVVVGEAAFVVREDGTTSSWGRNPPLGRISSIAPDPVPGPILLGRVSSLDLVVNRACATQAGTGYCWGTGWGLDGKLDRALPQPVVAPEPLVQISTTPTSSPQWRWCAVGASGDVYCFGPNTIGQAGDGTKDHAYSTVKVKGLPAPAVQVKTTPTSTCALLTNGKVYCWGSNFYGQLGSGMFKVPSLSPQEVVLP